MNPPSSDVQWEFSYLTVPTGFLGAADSEKLLADLNAKGADGWQFGGAIPGVADQGPFVVLQRPVRHDR
jgi:hypothetical protein